MLWMKIEFNLWSCAFKLSSFHVKVVLNLTSLNPILLLIYLTSCGKKKFINKILTEKQSFYILLFVCTCLIFLFHFLDNKIGHFVLFSGIYIYKIEKSVFIWLNKKKGFIDRFCALGPIFVLIFSLVKINKLLKKKKKKKTSCFFALANPILQVRIVMLRGGSGKGGWRVGYPMATDAPPCLFFSHSSKGTAPTESYVSVLLFIRWAIVMTLLWILFVHFWLHSLILATDHLSYHFQQYNIETTNFTIYCDDRLQLIQYHIYWDHH